MLEEKAVAGGVDVDAWRVARVAYRCAIVEHISRACVAEAKRCRYRQTVVVAE